MVATHSASQSSLRVWPGVALAVIVVLARYVMPLMAPDGEVFSVPLGIIAVAAGILGALAIAVWWLLFSRAPWRERLAIVVLIAAAMIATRLLVHESIAGGMMGLMLWIFAPPLVAVALATAAGVAVARRLAPASRRTVIAMAVVSAAAVFTLIRTDGVTGDGASQLHWRWTPTAEQRLLADTRTPAAAVAPPAAAATPAREGPSAPSTADAAPAAPVAETSAADPPPAPHPLAIDRPVAWAGFRGGNRDAVIRVLHIDTGWAASPPIELWRRPIGPGWSSVAADGEHIYTQEQRGEDELVSCYSLATGELVWTHADAARFWESNGGAGPRGTPVLHDGRVYSLGATGILNALDAATGARLWARNAASDTGVVVPDWGVASSPLVIGDVVVVAVSGRLAAYDVRSGEPRWMGPEGGAGYSSPHLVTIDGVPQILLLRGSRTISVSPVDGSVLWEDRWQAGVGIVQPALATEHDVLITTGDAMGGLGIRRVSVVKGPAGWSVEERWTTRGLKPYFSDFVVHKGHAYGFDGSILAAIDLQDGTRRWKGGRYGSGQLLLLAEQDLLLIMSEDGDLALVSATPGGYQEVAKVPALNSKTWNHPAVVGDVLVIRNGEEMAAFRLPTVRTTDR